MKDVILKTNTGHLVSFKATGNDRQVLLNSRAIANIDQVDDVIKSIKYPGLDVISTNKQIYLKEPFRIEKISQQAVGTFTLSCIKELTKASQFLMPVLGQDKAYFLWNKHFINCYTDVEDSKYKFGTPHLYLVYRYSKHFAFQKFEKEIQSHEEFVRMFDIDEYHTMYVFKFPEFLESDYDNFRFGRYSEISEALKIQILDFHGWSEQTKMGKILNKSEEYRLELGREFGTNVPKGQELYSPPVPQRETYWNKYKITKSMKQHVEFE